MSTKGKNTSQTVSAIIVSGILIVVGYTSYKQGYATGSDKSWSAGYQSGRSVGHDEAYNEASASTVSSDEYNDLVDEYNELRQAAINYVGNTYKPKQSLNCTSNTIGSTTFTNCN